MIAGTFHPKDPISVASAIHIRKLTLQPKESIADLTEFEEAVYIYYARFCQTKTPKFDAPRRYLPSPVFFCNWEATTRIITPMTNAMKRKNKKQPCSRKWDKLVNGPHSAQDQIKVAHKVPAKKSAQAKGKK